MGLDFINDFAFGKAGKAKKSGIFEGAEDLGGEFSNFLSDRLNTPVQDSKAFKQGASALRDNLSLQSATQRQRLGNTASTRGFLDSGAVFDAESDLARAELGQLSQGLSQLFLALDQRQTEGILPFLGLASQEHTGIVTGNAQQKTAARGQNTQFASDTISSFASVAGCWVAREIYGNGNLSWVLAWHYINRMAPTWFRDLYNKYGAELAAWLKKRPFARRVIKPLFDRFVKAAIRDMKSHG